MTHILDRIDRFLTRIGSPAMYVLSIVVGTVIAKTILGAW